MSTTRIIRDLTTCCGLAVLILIAGCGRSELGDPILKARPNPDDAAAVDVPLRQVADTPFEYSWDLQLPASVHMAWISPNVPELVFFQLDNRYIHAVDGATGMTKWVCQVGMPAKIVFPPMAVRTELPGTQAGERVIEDHLFVISDDWLFCIDAIYGQLVYRYHLGRKGPEGFQPSTGPLVFGHGENIRIFVGDWEGRVRCISYDAKKKMAYHKWQFNIYGTPTARPVGVEGMAFFGDHEGVLRAFGLQRDMQWEFDTRGGIFAAPAIRGRNLYLGSDAGKIHILNRLSGKEIDGIVLGYPIIREPMWFDDEPSRLYVWTAGDRPGLQAVYTSPDVVPFKGAPNKYPKEVERIADEWFVKDVDCLVSSSPEHLFLTKRGNDTMIYALNRKTGRFDWRWDLQAERDLQADGDLGPEKHIAHVVQYQDRRDLNRTIYTIDGTGYVVAYRLFGQFVSN